MLSRLVLVAIFEKLRMLLIYGLMQFLPEGALRKRYLSGAERNYGGSGGDLVKCYFSELC